VTGWDELVSAALLGTDRRPPDPATLPEPVRARLRDESDPARLLLDAAALSTAYRRAGRPPLRGLEPLPPATTDHRPVPRDPAIRRLAAMLEGSHQAVLGEWLRAVRDRGFRVPPELFPALADLARGRTELREPVAVAAGPRSTWLAAANPDWQFLAGHAVAPEPADRRGAGAVADSDGAATPADGDRAVGAETAGDDLWRHGSAAERRRWLATARKRDPGRARDALVSSWKAEPGGVRAESLALFADGLSTADEEFLEAALDDRAREVRRIAAGLLAVLDGSSYQGRMTSRTRECLSTRRTGAPTRRRVLTVTLPDECDDAMRRDGIEPRPPRGVGERTWWLQQLLAAAPLSAYDGPEMLQYEVEGVDAELLHAALAEAAVRERSADWARALLRTSPAAGHRTAELIGVLPPDEWATAVAAVREIVPPVDIVGRLPAPWPAGLATMLLDVLAVATPDRSWARLASVTALSVPRAALDHPITHEPPGDEETWRRRLVETLVFRREMYEELS